MHLVLIIYLFSIYFVLDSTINKSQKRRFWQCLTMGLGLFLFAALRAYTVGSDVLAYFHDFINDSNWSISEIIDNRRGRDPFFHIMLHILSLITPDPQIMLVVIGAVVAYGFSYFVYHQKGNVLLMYMMFIGFRMFSFTLSGLRQAVALGLVFIAIIMLERKRTWLFVLFTLVGSIFHTTCSLFFLAYPLVKIKSTALVILSSLGIAILNQLSGNAITMAAATIYADSRFAGYANMFEDFEGTSTFYIYIIIASVAVLLYRQMKRADIAFEQNMRIMSLGIMFSIIGQSVSNVFRIAYYFIIHIFCIYPQILDTLTNNKQLSKMLAYLSCILLAIQYIWLGTSAGTDNYKFFWDNPFTL